MVGKFLVNNDFEILRLTLKEKILSSCRHIQFIRIIVLRDRRAGGYGFCKPAGDISSQGSEAPEG